ncbi:DUF58 domain-containing protein [Halapricum desulfuricans]|uniref:DUF58 domain-containing protein n=1 Tax=Halapricum desulfuricans TaxID=2841257 RepID=UPI001E39635C|nr:DUF58 domain-containing protein [Halapricum desulfuricans]
MRPTRRGLAVLALAAAAIALGQLFGARSLDAVAVPAIVVLTAGLVQVALATDPAVTRRPLSPGFAGETRTVTVEVDGGHGVVALSDAVPDGVVASGSTATVTPPATVTYDIRSDHRGAFVLGPTTVGVRDVFGLFERTAVAGDEHTYLAYPPVHEINATGPLDAWLGRQGGTDRQTVTELREYVPGDPPTDIHWRASARHPDSLLVADYGESADDGGVTVVAGADPGAVDEMAAATASIAVALDSANVALAVVTPDGTARERDAILSLLARTGPGRPDADADIRIDATQSDTVVVTADGRETTFDTLRTPVDDAGGGDSDTRPLAGEPTTHAEREGHAEVTRS